jgi:hypothetical protein
MITLRKNSILNDIRISKEILVHVGKTESKVKVGNVKDFAKATIGELFGLAYVVAIAGGVYLLYSAGGILLAIAGLAGFAYLMAG